MDALSDHDVELVMADNPSPFTLTGTNTWLVGRDPCWVIDPGPDLDGHLDAITAAAAARGGVEGIVLTHDHGDHSGGLDALLARLGGDVRVGAARHPGTDVLADGDVIGPLHVLHTPGHAPDHVAFLTATGVAFTGDCVLGTGSVFVWPDRGALSGYLRGLARLRERGPVLLCPGHGPLVTEPAAKIDEYVAHRLERERRLVAALDAGHRSVDALLDEAWSDAPQALRLAATFTLAAHLDKLEEEDRLPEGVERPDVVLPTRPPV